MANVKISALPASAGLDGTEIVPVVDGGVTQRTTTSDIAGLVPPIDLSNYSSTNDISLTTSLDSTIVANGTITLESQSGPVNIHTNSTSESINIQTPGDDCVITIASNGSFGVTNIRANGPSGIVHLEAAGNGGGVFVKGGDTNGTIVISALQGDAQLILGITNQPDVDLAGRNVFIHPTGDFGVSCFPAGTITLDASPNGQIIQNANSLSVTTGFLGFFGVAPTTQPPVPVTLGDVIAALQSLGLVGT